jgi:hypothetical protein
MAEPDPLGGFWTGVSSMLLAVGVPSLIALGIGYSQKNEVLSAAWFRLSLAVCIPAAILGFYLLASPFVGFPLPKPASEMQGAYRAVIYIVSIGLLVYIALSTRSQWAYYLLGVVLLLGGGWSIFVGSRLPKVPAIAENPPPAGHAGDTASPRSDHPFVVVSHSQTRSDHPAITATPTSHTPKPEPTKTPEARPPIVLNPVPSSAEKPKRPEPSPTSVRAVVHHNRSVSENIPTHDRLIGSPVPKSIPTLEPAPLPLIIATAVPTVVPPAQGQPPDTTINWSEMPHTPTDKAAGLLLQYLQDIKAKDGITHTRLSEVFATMRFPAPPEQTNWPEALFTLQAQHHVANVSPIAQSWQYNGVGFGARFSADFSFDILDITATPTPTASPSP